MTNKEKAYDITADSRAAIAFGKHTMVTKLSDVKKAIEIASKPDEIQEQTLTEIRRIQTTVRDSGKNMSYKLIIEDNEIEFSISINSGFDIVYDECRLFNACDFKTNIEHLQSFISKIDVHKLVGL